MYEDGGDLGHGDHFRGNRTMHVPLIVDAPAFFPQRLRVTGLVSTMDIAPTLEAIAGAEPGPGLAGVDLRVAARDGVSPHKDLVFETGLWFAPVSTGYLEGRRIPYPDITELGEIDFDAGTGISIKSEYFDITNIAKHRMLYTGRYKLLYLPTGRGIKWELYDLLYDAGESMDISGESRALTRRLARRLLDALAAAPNTEIRNDFILPLEPAD
ncbi:MAG: hypothetical protein M5R36_03565 [Deltaproteobacteria bacterium]|nr:hypothetical protein [Deltaproteobacteria bacterium]